MMAWISPKVIAVICTHVFHWKGDLGSYVLMPTGLSKMARWSVSMVNLSTVGLIIFKDIKFRGYSKFHFK